MGKVIAISSQKGGVGKTTTAINLATSLAIFEQNVLIIDLDPQGSVGISFHLDEYNVKFGLYEIMVKDLPMARTILNSGLDYLDLVPANIHSEEQEIELYSKALKLDLLKTIIAPIKNGYDFIIVDCPPNLGSMTLNGLVAADSVIIPVVSEYYSMKALGKFLNTLKNISKKYNPHLKIAGILVTMFDKRIKKHKEIVEYLRTTFRELVFDTVIPRNSKVAEAPSYGRPVLLHSIKSEGALAYLRLAEEIMKRKNTNKL